MLSIIENILADEVLFREDYGCILNKTLEFSSKGNKKIRENSIILITKILESFSQEVEENVSLKILEKLVELLDDGDTEVRRASAYSIGIVMMAIGN